MAVTDSVWARGLQFRAACRIRAGDAVEWNSTTWMAADIDAPGHAHDAVLLVHGMQVAVYRAYFVADMDGDFRRGVRIDEVVEDGFPDGWRARREVHGGLLLSGSGWSSRRLVWT